MSMCEQGSHLLRRAIAASLLAIATRHSRPAIAQGIAGASIQGFVTNAAGKPVTRAEAELVDSSNGNRRVSATSAAGAYRFDNVPVGGPYSIHVRALGYQSASIVSITLHVGDRLVRNVVLGDRVTVLDEIAVRGSALRDAGAGGPVHTVAGQTVRDLPLRDRDFVGLFAIAPQATPAVGGLSIGGQHVRLNAIQVDGGSSEDYFAGLTSGVSAGAKSLSLEALREIRVQVAPFDVRQGGFSAGVINATTRSGTNELRGSAFTSAATADLVGRDTAGNPAQGFHTVQYGFSVGGPIVRDKLHLFVVGDFQARRKPFVGPRAEDSTTGIGVATAEQARESIRRKFGFDPGGSGAPINAQPNRNLFLKLSWQPSPSNTIELTHNWVDARIDTLDRTKRTQNDRNGWELSGSGWSTRVGILTTRLKLVSTWGSVGNELVASWGTVNARLQSAQQTPLFLVQGDLEGNYLAAGSVKNAQGVATDERLGELGDDVSWSRGAHVITVGTRAQLVHIRDNFSLGTWGTWTYGSVDSLERDLPLRYDISLLSRPGQPLSDYGALQLGSYVQDRWQATARISLTAGVRVDVPFFDQPTTNPKLVADGALRFIDTGRFPSGNAVFSPRVGFSIDLGNEHATMLRGGIGAFAGHPLYSWLTGAHSNTGREQSLLVCTSLEGVPAATADIARLPTRCVKSSAAPPVPSVTYFAPDFRFQQAIKFDLGFDHAFGHGIDASIDVMTAHTNNTLYVSDVNLIERGTNGEGRTMYGAIGTTGSVRPTRLDSTSFGAVYRFENRSGDRYAGVSFVVRKQWRNDALAQIAYGWSATKDLMSLSGMTGQVISQSNPLDGTIGDRRLRRSSRDVPHNFLAIIAGATPLATRTSLFLRARSGTPYAYVASKDANADGAVGNDLVFVPATAADISLRNPAAYPALEAYIGKEPCLRSQRGRIMARNSCRNPSVFSLDARSAKQLVSLGGRAFEVNVDVFNVPNLVNNRWGLVRQTTASESVELVTVSGWDALANRPGYSIPTVLDVGTPILPSRNAIVDDASRWRLQLGARYTF